MSVRIDLILVGLLAASPVLAAESDVFISPDGQLRLQDWGTYVGRDAGVVAADDTVEGKVHRQEDTTLLEQGDTICARSGTTFGIRYRLADSVTDPNWDIMVDTRHPLLVTPSGRSGVSGSYTTTMMRGHTGYTGWTVRYAYEHVAGDYIFTLMHGGAAMLRKTFHVTFDCTVPVS